MNKLLILSFAVFTLTAFNSNASSINEYGEEDPTIERMTDSSVYQSVKTDPRENSAEKSDYNYETHDGFGAYPTSSC